MESVESPLDVLSRAATMMQHCHNYPASDSDSFESPSTASGGESEGDRTLSPEAPAQPRPVAKQLPSAKWRRERRSTRLPDYKPRENGNKALRSQSFNEHRSNSAFGRPTTHSEGESPDEDERTQVVKTPISVRGAPPEYPGEAPIDMRLKSRPCPPAYPANRPSVITHSPTPTATGSMSMCDPVIDEHFRRSLGDDYMTLFKKNPQEPSKKTTKDRGSSPIMFPSDPCINFLVQDKKKVNEVAEQDKTVEKPNGIHKKDGGEKLIGADSQDLQEGVKENGQNGNDKRSGNIKEVICEDVEMELDSASSSVDDHFAKALGDTWKKIQISRHLTQQKEEDGDKLRRGVVI